MAARRRFSIGMLMVVVGLVAADFAIVRALWDHHDHEVGFAVLTLPTINLLILILPKLRPGKPRRAFWGGFVAGGVLAVLGLGGLIWGFGDMIFWPLNPLSRWLESLRLDTPTLLAIMIPLAISLYTPPLLLIAAILG